MKIISCSPHGKPPSQEVTLNMEIQRLHEENGMSGRPVPPFIIQGKASYLKILEDFIKSAAQLEQGLMEEEELLSMKKYENERTFHCFGELPTELRLKIWEHSIAARPRVHCINARESAQYGFETVMSNQPLSPMLHVNSESRSSYLSTTQEVFAFESYINFEKDIVYLVEDCPTVFQMVLDNPDSIHIQNFAMRKELLCDLPLDGSHFYLKHRTLTESLSGLKKIVTIFEDNDRDGESVWYSESGVYKEFSAKEKRARAERSYARAWCKVLNRMSELDGETIIDFRFGYLELGEEDD